MTNLFISLALTLFNNQNTIRMYRLLFFSFSFLLMTSMLSCEEPVQSEAEQETFPKPGAQLTAKQAQDLTFHWGKEAQAKKKAFDKQVFRMYQLDSVEEKNGKQFVHLKLLQEEVLANKNTVSTKANGRRKLLDNQIYVWEVTDQDKKVIKPRSSFGVAKTPLSLLEELNNSFFNICTTCYRLPGESGNCDKIVCEICPNANIHIVTLTGFDIVGGGGFEFRSSDIDTLNGDPCIKITEENIGQEQNITARFSVAVPCDSLSIVETSNVRIFLYKNGSLLSKDNPYDYSLELTLNNSLVFYDTSITSTEMAITQGDYLEFCEGITGDTLVCRAKVDIDLDLIVSDVDTNDAYTMVFYLPAEEGQEHTHGYPDSNTNTQTQNRTRKVKNLVTAHTHLNFNTSCLSQYPDTTSLAYFECLNADTSHIAQHVVVKSIAVCQ